MKYLIIAIIIVITIGIGAGIYWYQTESNKPKIEKPESEYEVFISPEGLSVRIPKDWQILEKSKLDLINKDVQQSDFLKKRELETYFVVLIPKHTGANLVINKAIYDANLKLQEFIEEWKDDLKQAGIEAVGGFLFQGSGDSEDELLVDFKTKQLGLVIKNKTKFFLLRKSGSSTMTVLTVSIRASEKDFDVDFEELVNDILSNTYLSQDLKPQTEQRVPTKQDVQRIIQEDPELFITRMNDVGHVGALKKVQSTLEIYYENYKHYPLVYEPESWKKLTDELRKVKKSYYEAFKIELVIPNDSSFKYGVSENGKDYVLSTTLEDKNNGLLLKDIDGVIYGINCDDPVFCLQF